VEKPTFGERHGTTVASCDPARSGVHPHPDIERWIERYVPRTVPRATWDSVLRPFVVPALHALAPMGIPSAGQSAWVLTRLGAWCLDEGLPLDPDVALDPDTVERFASVGLKDDASRGTCRAILRRIGPSLTSKAPWEPRPQALTHRAVALPYLGTELDSLAEDAHRQSTPARRRVALGLFLLGAGAGLDGRWVTKVRGIDVSWTDEAVLVRTGPPSPRVVPVLRRYEAELLDLAETAGEDLLIGGQSVHRNRASALAAKLEVGHGHPRLSVSRLRSTWLVHHLTVGTRLPELARAAGLSRVTVLSDLLEFVPPLGDKAARAMLRGEP
jgi:hypothetical protein